jgi:hypothetical protein
MENADPSVGRIETDAGIVSLAYISGSAARVDSGHHTGWLNLRGERLYATALFRRNGDVWTLDATHSGAGHVVDDKVSERAEVEVLDRAMDVLGRAFVEWRESRPDLLARAVLADRVSAERRAMEHVESLVAQLAEARGRLPALRTAREDAETAVAQALETMAGPPTP